MIFSTEKPLPRTKQQGILLINKPFGVTSFSLIPKLRYLCNEKTIGHGGTLDPLATGVMVYLIGRNYTKTADSFLLDDKEYEATILLGEERDSYDVDGTITHTSDKVPLLSEISDAMAAFNGVVDQIPPMFSAKKVNGKKLYELARKGQEIERLPKRVHMKTTIINYNYPHLEISVTCSSGTYIRSIAHDLGQLLGCYGCIKALKRTRSGPYLLENCHQMEDLLNYPLDELLIQH
jgi:tRNA pseudouridine55 synthase